MGNMIRAQALGLSLATLGVLAVASFSLAGQPTIEGVPTPRESDEAVHYFPEGGIWCNVWRENNGHVSGNSIQWEYQVAAKYEESPTHYPPGTSKVLSIKTEWWGAAALRMSASISIGVGAGEFSAGLGESWDAVETTKRYWENTLGQTDASYRDTVVVGPREFYMPDSLFLANRATVKVSLNPSYPYPSTCSI